MLVLVRARCDPQRVALSARFSRGIPTLKISKRISCRLWPRVVKLMSMCFWKSYVEKADNRKEEKNVEQKRRFDDDVIILLDDDDDDGE